MAFPDLISLPTENFPAIHKTIGELEVRRRTGASIIAAIREGDTVINPGPEYALSAGATLVVAGKRNHIKLLKEILKAGT